MQKWEYTNLYWDGDDLYCANKKIASGKGWNLLDFCNSLGDQGWEMLSPSVQQRLDKLNLKTDIVMRIYFKRPKEATQQSQ